MPLLKNAKHERFSQDVAKGDNPAKTYSKITGKKGKVAATMASRWLKKVDISTRINELQQKASTGTELTLAKKLEILAQIAMATPNVAAHDNPLSELKMSKAGPYYAFPDKLRAIELHAKLSGEMKDKVEHSGEVNHTVITEERRAELMQKKRASIERARLQ